MTTIFSFFCTVMMILLIAFLIMWALWPDANAEILYTETVWGLNPEPDGLKYLIATLYLVETFEESPCGTVGCFRYTDYTMWIVNGREGDGGGMGSGCSVLYHEILHLMGYADWYIKYHYPDWRCAVGQN